MAPWRDESGAHEQSHQRCGFRALWTLAGLALVTSGCAAMQASRQYPGTVAGDSFSPARPPAASYGVGALICPADGLNAHVVDSLADLAKKSGTPEVKADGRLCAMAETFLGWSGTSTPPESITRQVAWHFGLPGALPRLTITAFDTDDYREMSERIVETLAELAKRASAPRFGLQAEALPSADRSKQTTRTKVVLVTLDDALDLDPVPRALPLNGQARVSGRLPSGATNATLLACDASGKLETLAQPGGSFSADVRCGERAGTLRVEIRAERAGSPVVFARFPISCGTEAPTSFKIPPPPPSGSVDAAAAEQLLFQLLNTERAGAGAAPLAWDGATGKVARLASEALRAQAMGGSRSFDLVTELRQADALSSLVLQNPVVAISAEEAHALLLTSPVNRSNLLNPQATHAGVGMAAAADPNGGTVLYATELLIRQQPPVDAQALRGKLREAVAQKRAGANATPLASDETLESVAQKYASELVAAGGTIGKDREGDILAPLFKSYRSVNIISGAKSEPLEFAGEPRVLGAGTLLGVGVAQGSNPMLGKNAIYVVLISATKAAKK